MDISNSTGSAWQWLNKAASVSWERCWVCLGSGPPRLSQMLHSWCGAHPCPCQPLAELPCCASIWISGAFPVSVWTKGALRPCRGSEEGLFYRFPSPLGCNSASAGTWQRCCCYLEKSCCSSGMFTEVSKPGSGRRDSCHGLKKKREWWKEGRKAKILNSTRKENSLSFLSQAWNWNQMVKQPWLFFPFVLFFKRNMVSDRCNALSPGMWDLFHTSVFLQLTHF